MQNLRSLLVWFWLYNMRNLPNNKYLSEDSIFPHIKLKEVDIYAKITTGYMAGKNEMMLNLIKKRTAKNLDVELDNVIIFAVRPGILSVCLKTSRCSM